MHQESKLPLTSIFLALLVAVVWGFNFVMVKLSLTTIPPLTLCAIRFFLCAFPMVFFVPFPRSHTRYILGYGIITFGAQFALLFTGVALGVSPGTAALISQTQVFFGIFFAWFLLNQTVTPIQLLGACIALSGIGLLFLHHDSSLSIIGFFLIILASISWGLGNLISTQLRQVPTLSLMSWSSLVAFCMLTALAFIFENPLPYIQHPFSFHLMTYFTLAYIVYGSTYIGYGCWSWLLSRYPFASISPFALLCPIIAMIGSAIVFHESLTTTKIIAGLLVILGVAINSFGRQVASLITTVKQKIK
jgi:O-acetylserine/cysteine efflux transporter